MLYYRTIMIRKKYVITRSKLIELAVLATIIASFSLMLIFQQWRLEHAFLHGVFEWMSISCALLIVLLIGAKQSDFRIGAADALCISAALVTTAMLTIFQLVSHPVNNFIWLHSFAILTGGSLFAAVWMPEAFSHFITKAFRNVPMFMALVTIIFALWSSNYPELLPVMIHEGQFTLNANLMNILGSLGYLGAAIFFLKRYLAGGSREYMLLTIYSLMFCLSGMLFVFSTFWGATWWLLHGLQLTAQMGLMISIVRGVYLKLGAEGLENQFCVRDGEVFYEQGVLVSKAMGLFSILLGAMVVVGWYTHSAILIQVMPQFAPMQINTAFVILASGIAVLGLSWGKRKLVLIVGAAVAFIGGLTLCEYVFEVDFGIDQFMVDGYISVRTSHLGRMSPNTAICSFLMGMALIFVSSGRYQKLSTIASQLFVLIVFSIAVMSFLGYFINEQQSLRNDELTRMAIHTSLGFIALCTGVLAFGWGRRNERIASVPLWLPGVFYMIVFLVDFYTPKEFTTGIAYVPLICCAFWFVHQSASFMLAFVSTVLIIIGYFVSPAGSMMEEGVIVNSVLSIIAVWVIAFIINMHRYADLRRRDSEQRYRISVEGASAGVWDWNADKKRFYSSDRFKEITGTLHNTVPLNVKNIFRHLHPVGRKRLFNNLRRHLKYREKIDCECQYLVTGKDGVWLQVRGQAIWNDTGVPIRMAGSIEDITERKRVEKELEHRVTELKTSNQDLDDFAYIASHDLREPLRGINNHAHSLIHKYKCSFDPEVETKLHRIIKLTQRIDALINDLFQYARLGRTQLAIERVNIKNLVKDIADEFTATYGSRHIRILWSSSLPNMLCDKVKANIVLKNIVSNAIKYNDSIEKTVEIDYIAAARYNDKVISNVFSIKDNGIGIDKEMFDEIFRIFKLLNSAKVYGEGTGAGLTFVKKIIEKQGGVIWLESQPKVGTTFYFTLSGV